MKNIKNTNGDFYELNFKIFKEFLALSFFLDKDELPPPDSDLIEFIHNASRDSEFIEYLILGIHRLVYVENFPDELKTAISMHLAKKMNDTEESK